MNQLTRNQLVSRRGFIQRAADSAKLAGLGAALGMLGRARSTGAAAEGNPWAYDDSRFRKTDSKLIHYREINRFRAIHPKPRCLALSHDEHLFIGACKNLTEHTLQGAQVSDMSLESEPRCVAAGDDGLLYLGMREHVEVYDRQGQRRTSWPSPGPKAYFTGVTTSGADVFVADAGQRVLLRYDRSGKLIGRIGEKNKERNVPGFIVPSPYFDVEVAPDGLLRVNNPGRHRVEAYTFEGDLEFAWGEPGAGIEKFCGCCNPINLALLGDGRIVTLEKGIPRVKVYTGGGTLESVVAGAESFAENAKVCGPNDCTLGGLDGVVDSKDRIYILDFVAADIRVMERNPSGG
jgi:hypothetical protein